MGEITRLYYSITELQFIFLKNKNSTKKKAIIICFDVFSVFDLFLFITLNPVLYSFNFLQFLSSFFNYFLFCCECFGKTKLKFIVSNTISVNNTRWTDSRFIPKQKCEDSSGDNSENH